MNADRVLMNAKVYSINDTGEELHGEAIAISAGKILKVGSYDEISKYICPDTDVIDCNGNSVLPGLSDVHCHPASTAGIIVGCNLFGVYIDENKTANDVIDIYLDRIKEFVSNHPDDDLIRGTGWVLGNFEDNELPTKEMLDNICSDRPVVLESFCQHNLWVNSKAIELAGINKDTPDVYAGKIWRDKSREPSGIFSDVEAMNLIKLGVPGYELSVEDYKKAFVSYQREFANKYGVTLVQDCMHSENAREAYIQLAEEGKLTVRLRGVYPISPDSWAEELEEYLARNDNVNDDFRIDTIKIFAEGAFVMNEPYLDGTNGELFWDTDEMLNASIKALDNGYQLHFHAMGDKTIDTCVGVIKDAQNITGKKCRNVVAHLMIVSDETAKTMAENDIVGNCQPRWMVYDSDIEGMVDFLGEERANAAYPLRKLLDNGVKVAYGTDFPVTPPPDPMHEIQCAMTRTVFKDASEYDRFKGIILGDERPAELNEAIKSLTINAAFQTFLEDITGSIEEGKSADLVILDRDIENTPIDEIYSIEVLETIFKGKTVYNK